MMLFSQPISRKSLGNTLSLMTKATILSRVLGLFREQMFAALLGATAFADAFIIAFRIPNLLRDLFAEGALSQAFIPVFTKTTHKHGLQNAYTVTNRIIGNLIIIVGSITLLLGIFTPTVVYAIAGGYATEPDKIETTVLLTRIMLPFLPFISIATVAMGMLNAQDHYKTPALAPILFNIVALCVGALLWWSTFPPYTLVIIWSIAVVLGGMAQLIVQIPALYKLGYRFKLSFDLCFRNAEVRKVVRLMGPAALGVAAIQINIFVNSWFASTEPGAVSWLNYAFRFLQLPIGVLGVSLATAAIPRYADAATTWDKETISNQISQNIHWLLFLTVPATIGLLLLGEPIIALIYERGEFTSIDTANTAAALSFYLPGLVTYAGVKVIAPAFYSLENTRIPMIASMIAVAINVILNATLHPIYGYRILAMGTAIAAFVNFFILYGVAQKQIGSLDTRKIIGQFLKVSLACMVMALCTLATYQFLESLFDKPLESLSIQILLVGIPIGIAIFVYAGVCYLLHIPQLIQLIHGLKHKI